jgi:hypothetical protein
MAQRANLIATYNSNPTLQSRYTLQQYLDLFGFGQTTTPTPDPDPDPTPTPTPEVPGIPNIINQNLGGGDGSDGGPQGIARPPQTYTRTYAPDLNFAEFTSGITGTPSYTQEYNKPETIFDLYQKFSPVGIAAKFFNDRKEFKQAQTNKALEQVAMQQKIREAERQAAIDAATVTYQYNNPSQKAVDDPSGGNRADAFTGGGANVAAANYTSTGREGFGYGLADGGRVYLYNRLK